MDDLSPKERLHRTLAKKSVDRRPVICPGGMMNAAVVEVQENSGRRLPAAHANADLMADLAKEVSLDTGFENYGIPFCMTVEPEVLGSEIDLGTVACEPKITREIYPDAASVVFRNESDMLKSGRIAVVSEAVAKLAASDSDVPVIGSVTGPVSTAASIVDPMTFLKDLRKRPQDSHKVMDYVTNFLSAYAGALIDSGAEIISISDPTATGEILGPKMFETYALPYINRLADYIRGRGVKVILHICGEMRAVRSHIPAFRADAISTDAMVNLKNLKADYPDITTMGNLSTYLLEFGESDKVAARTEALLNAGIDIIAPACGLSTASSLKNLRAFTGTVKEKV
ncbi:MAG: methylcobamide--CoM methyltransferase [Clostridiales Family XIII bacterium]|jgi:[methyl-Co(III) methanol-specific corrinoid protein]:coenzyme M methyltransferase|nr:methylcobamide--CoM methyltransferase [Clostridiales Family XIII bacterium]